MEFRTPHDQLTFQLELNNSNSFMHFYIYPVLAVTVGLLAVNIKAHTGIAFIRVNGQCSQR